MRSARLLPHDREHGLVVQLGVVEAIQKVHRTRARRGHAHPDFASELRVRAGHERAHFLVPGAHQFDLIANAIERPHQPVDAVAGVGVHPPHPPLVQSVEQKVADHGR
jgi:hypothetical protein